MSKTRIQHGVRKFREGELVRYQVKAKNSNVADATVVISDATGLPLYTLQTDAFGFTPQISLPSDFYLDRNWNHLVGESNVEVTVSPGITEFMDENTCSDGYDNDGDTFVDDGDQSQSSQDTSNCDTGNRELPFYSVNAYKFGKGADSFDFVLNGPIEDIISLDNLKPSVAVTQGDGASFATTATLTGTAWDGLAGPYPLDIVAYEKQFGLIKRVEFNHRDHPNGIQQSTPLELVVKSPSRTTHSSRGRSIGICLLIQRVKAMSPSVFVPTMAWTTHPLKSVSTN